MMLIAIAFLWGAAEASVFFIVPDLFVTFVAARRGTAAALRAALAAAAGAIVGGIALFLFARSDPATVEAMLLALPGIDAEQRAIVAESMAADWFRALFAGAVGGIPFKLFVADAASRAIDPLLFFLVSVPARLLRFAVGAILAGAIASRVPARWRLPLWAIFWLLLYAAYFATVGF